ncbi:MAG: histidine utilization repressor [Xanthomonadales bacterium]|nr:histidine utilization repressor [Xanthomonadales bacterium]
MTPKTNKDFSRVGPLYAKIKRHILGRIMTGELGVNTRVPSENELVRSFGVSRMTANRALKELTEEGYLVRVAGVGTFVADFKARSPLLEVRNIADEVRARGHDYSSEIVANGLATAPDDVAGQLGLSPSSKVFRTLVVHREQGMPIQFEERFVNRESAPRYGDADFRAMTPGEYLLKTVPLQEAQHTVRACMPGKLICEHLQMDDSEPCLLVERLTWSGNRPVTFVRLYHPGTRFELSGRFKP